MKIGIIGAAAALLMGASGAQAAITFYNSEAAFKAAVGQTATETFTDSNLLAKLSVATDAGNIAGGKFNDRVVRGGAQTRFSFLGGTTGAGGFWDESPGGFGQGLALTISLSAGGSELLSQEIVGFSGGFFGFTSTDSFDSLLITAGTQAGVAETYNLDNLSWGAVPEPQSWALLIAGFGMIGAAARRRRTALAA